MPNSNILFNQVGPNEMLNNALLTGQNVNQTMQAPLRNQLLKDQVESSRLKGLDEQTQFQLKDMTQDALMIKPYLESGNIEQAIRLTENRAEKIRQRDGDPSHTLDVLRKLKSGDIQGAMIDINAPIQASERLGLLNGDAGLTEYQRRNLDLQERRLNQEPLTTNERDFEKYQALKKTDPQAAEAFGKKAGFVSDEGDELSVHLQKRLSESTDAANESAANVVEFNQLADDIEKANIRGGLFGGKWTESFKEISGSQDAVTILRKRYFGIRSSQAVKNLPPGVASDKDIELALKGFPGETANKQEISSFLRGMAKMEQAINEFSTFKAQYISENGTERGLLDDWRERNKQQEQSSEQPKNREGWQLMIDANGNKAYVGPNGEIEEVQ